MDFGTLQEKIRAYLDGDGDVEHLHQLRVQTRKALSHLDSQHPLYAPLKSLIKQSNTIRDLDVMLTETTMLLPHWLYLRLEEHHVLEKLRLEKHVLEARFKQQLDQLNIDAGFPDSTTHDTTAPTKPNPPTLPRLPKTLDKSQKLHKYRIKVKQTRYLLESQHPKEKKRIRLLKKIQERLGKINDFHVLIDKLESLAIDPDDQKAVKKALDLYAKRYLKQTHKLTRVMLSI